VIDLGIDLFAIDSAEQASIGKSKQIFVAASLVPDPPESCGVQPSPSS
jgi:hypothetical protein